MIKIFCKSKHSNIKYVREFLKYKTYYILKNSLEDGDLISIFVYQKENVYSSGLWFSKKDFHDTFTLDNKWLREDKLKRILG